MATARQGRNSPESLNSILGYLPVVYLVEGKRIPDLVQSVQRPATSPSRPFRALGAEHRPPTSASYRCSGPIAYARRRAAQCAKVIRRTPHSLSDDEKLYPASVDVPEGDARPDRQLAELLMERSPPKRLAAIRQEVDGEVNDAAGRAVRAPSRPDTAVRLLAGCRSTSRRSPRLRRRVGLTRWSRSPALKDEMCATADRRLCGRTGRLQRPGSRRRLRQGRSHQVTHAAADVRQRSGLQCPLAGQHHRPRRGCTRAQASRRFSSSTTSAMMQIRDS